MRELMAADGWYARSYRLQRRASRRRDSYQNGSSSTSTDGNPLPAPIRSS